MASVRMQDSSIQIDHRSERSLPTFLLHAFLRPIRSQLLKFGNPIEEESPKVELTFRAKHNCDITERFVNDLRVYDFRAKVAASSSDGKRKRIIYFAGGGWQMPPSSQHITLCAALANRMPNTTLSLVSYPLAPHFAAPKSMPRLCGLYTTMLEAAADADETVIIAGDSAGGNIALCLPIYMLNTGSETTLAPAAIMALSPSTDLRRQNPDMETVAKHDPILTVPFIKSTADKWRAEWDALDPRVSPLAADLKVLAAKGVSVNGITGSYDILSPDAILFRTKLAEAGVRGRWLEWDQQMHVWVLTQQYGFKEAKEGLEWIAKVLNEV